LRNPAKDFDGGHGFPHGHPADACGVGHRSGVQLTRPIKVYFVLEVPAGGVRITKLASLALDEAR
jgi:hypothetical protein